MTDWTEAHQHIHCTAIEIPKDRERDVTEEGLALIRQSITEGRIENPIIVRETSKDHYRLIAGAHRLTIARELGHSTIPALVRSKDKSEMAELDDKITEIDENFARADLTKGERSVHTTKRKKAVAKRAALIRLQVAEDEVKAEKAAKGKVSKRTRDAARDAKKAIVEKGATGTETSPKLTSQPVPVNRRAAAKFTKETAKARGVTERTVKREDQFGEAVLWAAFLTDTKANTWTGRGNGADNSDALESLASLRKSYGAWTHVAETAKSKAWRKHSADQVKGIESSLKEASKVDDHNKGRKATFKALVEQYAYMSEDEFNNQDAKEALAKLNALVKDTATYQAGIERLVGTITDQYSDMESELRTLSRLVEKLSEVKASLSRKVAQAAIKEAGK